MVDSRGFRLWLLGFRLLEQAAWYDSVLGWAGRGGVCDVYLRQDFCTDSEATGDRVVQMPFGIGKEPSPRWGQFMEDFSC